MQYSDMNGFPESGFPVLADFNDRIVLNALYSAPARIDGYILDLLGNSRLLGALVLSGAMSGVTSISMNGALSGASTIAASGNVTLSAGNLLLTAGNIKMIGEISDNLARVKKLWLKDLDLVNRPTIGEDFVALLSDLQAVDYEKWKLAWYNAGSDATELFDILSTKSYELAAGDNITIDQPTVSGDTTTQTIHAIAPVTLAKFYADSGNVSTGVTDSYSYTLPANTLTSNGQRLEMSYSGFLANNGNSKTMNVLFGSTSISGLITSAANTGWQFKITLIRVTSSTIRVEFGLIASGVYYPAPFDFSSINFTTTNVIKLTLQGGATNDTVAKMATIVYWP